MDLWPESLEMVGGIKNKWILSYFTKLIQKFYKESEKILITSKGFRKSILKKGDFEDKIEYFPNWAEDSISEGKLNYIIPKLPTGFKIMFAGNVGESQDMETIMQSALSLKHHSNIKFIIVGEGRRIKYVKNFIKNNDLNNTVYTMGRYPIEAMSTFFNKADLLLVSLKDDPIFNLTVPAKVQAYMSAGKPILAMLNGEGADTILEANCGFVVPASNDKILTSLILEASKLDKRILEAKGRNGKLYFQNNFKMSVCIDNLEKILQM
jgi:glycosyltransferase involved in cell wall biosynthesis